MMGMVALEIEMPGAKLRSTCFLFNYWRNFLQCRVDEQKVSLNSFYMTTSIISEHMEWRPDLRPILSCSEIGKFYYVLLLLLSLSAMWSFCSVSKQRVWKRWEELIIPFSRVAQMNWQHVLDISVDTLWHRNYPFLKIYFSFKFQVLTWYFEDNWPHTLKEFVLCVLKNI